MFVKISIKLSIFKPKTIVKTEKFSVAPSAGEPLRSTFTLPT